MYSYDRTAAGIKPGEMAPIEYVYDHPSHGQLSIRYSGDRNGWFVIDAKQKVLATKLLTGLKPTPNRNAMRMVQQAVDRELASQYMRGM